MVEMHGNAVLFRRRLDDAQALRHHFLADAVAGNDRDPIRASLRCSSRDFLDMSCRSANAAYLIVLQWTKLDRRATLQCNVDRGRLRPDNFRRHDPTIPNSE